MMFVFVSVIVILFVFVFVSIHYGFWDFLAFMFHHNISTCEGPNFD